MSNNQLYFDANKFRDFNDGPEEINEIVLCPEKYRV